ncbi:MAG: hypothetical protein NVS2B16_22470 [Chloroflexota bacterium]
MLADEEHLDQATRTQIIADLVDGFEEMTRLVGDGVELAWDQERPMESEAILPDHLVADATTRVARHQPFIRFQPHLYETTVTGAAQRIDWAVTNLLDNAAKWSTPGGAISVLVEDGSVTVRDHGPGIAVDDLPHVFDRFYRSTTARATPGSGLGLAIVRQVAETHGGSVSAETAVGGGALLRLSLPLYHNLA